MKLADILKEKIPETAVPYIMGLWHKDPFRLRVTRQRTTKLGDYRFIKKARLHELSVNGDLNKYAFLITLVHEIAHQWVQTEYKGHPAPHGREWKLAFKKLMAPIMNTYVFPDKLLRVLAKHMKNPLASSTSDMDLTVTLRNYDTLTSQKLMLSDLSNGERFIYKRRHYKVLHHRRTRVLCEDSRSGKKYLIPMVCEIERSD